MASLTPLALRSLELLAECDDGVAYGVATSSDSRQELSSNVGVDPFADRLSKLLPRHLIDGVLRHGNLLEPSGLTGVGSKRKWKPVIGFNQEVRDFLRFWVACARPQRGEGGVREHEPRQHLRENGRRCPSMGLIDMSLTVAGPRFFGKRP
jgi:hypothetical protein